MSDLIRPEVLHAINGVPGRLNALRIPPAPWKAGTFGDQTWVSERRPIEGYGRGAWMQVDIRMDDNCRNGHNTFSMTAEVRRPGGRDCEACGCMHEDIARVFPELVPLIRWHLVSTDGPMHYIANTVYHASERDHNGLLKGERRQIRNGRTGLPSWELVALVDGEHRPARVDGVPRYLDSEAQPEAPAGLQYAPWCRVGEGKARELAHARASAAWPEATDAELCVDAAALRVALHERLPGLLADFRRDIEAAGFLWSSLP